MVKISSIRTSMDRAGRLVIPKPIRERRRLVDGGEVGITERDGFVDITPAAVRTEIVASRHGALLRALEPVSALTDDVVRTTIEVLRR